MFGVEKNRWFIWGVALLLLGSLSVRAEEETEPSLQELWGESIQAEKDGDIALALEIHQQILPKIGRSYTGYLRQGWLLYNTEKYKEALGFYEKASSISSGALSALFGAMNCHVALGNDAKATRVAKSIVSIDELNYTANLQLAALYYKGRRFSLASSYYRKLNRLYPEDLAVMSGLAWSHLEQGEARSAKPLFKNILLVSPDYAYAQKGLDLCGNR